ncbi:MAG TPA: GntR family transcriptional regulator [Candidatus Scubalenecus merdavium]|uniref:GntR family transcriptional regulator n=1 Tax=Candidatus Scybalenecus merdavium TaxID=2840939 RepID=A0A9D1SNK6_9FIRM|nr:GntR family transcriptional regulator [Candidatus Scubalenecus merdavium]
MEKSVPLWLEISRKIEKDIENGTFAVGDMLPNEYQLCEIYSVSRITIRGALARLSDLGKIKRVKGKGTIVTQERIKEPLLKISGFTDEMREKGIVPSTSYAHMERKKVSGYIAELFGQSRSTYFAVLERVRCINGVPVGYFTTYLPESIGLPYDSAQYYSSLYDKLAKEHGIVVDHVQQTVTAEIADKKTRKMLNLSPGEAVMVMKRKAFLGDKLIEYSVCRYDSKRYEYNMELRSEPK